MSIHQQQHLPHRISADLIRSNAEDLTRLLHRWHPDTRLSAHSKTAAALSELRAAIEDSLPPGDHQR
jgi:hypothetical protein